MLVKRDLDLFLFYNSKVELYLLLAYVVQIKREL